MKFFTLSFILVILCSTLRSQEISNQLLSTAGQVSQSKNIQLEWSLGEIATTFFYNGDGLYTQGFHQPVIKKRSYDDNTLSIKSANIEVWPNPTQNYLSIKVLNSTDKDLTFALFNTNGELLRNIEVEGKDAQFTLNLEKLLPGFYHLKIFNSEGILIDHQKVIKSL